MKAGTLAVAFLSIILLAGSSPAGAFSFCFSAGGGGNHRGDYFRGPPPAVGFGPGIYQTYPYSPVYRAPYGGGYNMPPAQFPRYESLPPVTVPAR